MAETIIHLDGELPLKVLDEKGWAQGAWTADDGKVCAHQAIRLCSPMKGDAFLIERVETQRGHGVAWNDRSDTTEAEVRQWLEGGIDVTDEDLETTFGPQWKAIVEVVRKAADLTPEQANRLDAARGAAQAAARAAAQAAARDAARGAARGAAWDAARGAAWDAAWDAARGAAWDAAQAAAQAAARGAARGAVVWDLASEDGYFTYAQRDLLMAPWVEVFGLPVSLNAPPT